MEQGEEHNPAHEVISSMEDIEAPSPKKSGRFSVLPNLAMSFTAWLPQFKPRARAIPIDADQRQRWQDDFNSWASVQHMGFMLDLSDSHVAVLTLPAAKPHHLGGMGNKTQIINGAIISGAFDAVLGVAGILQFPGQRAGTVELSIKLMRPVFGPFHAIGYCLRKAATVSFVEAHVINHGKICATATGMCAVAKAS